MHLCWVSEYKMKFEIYIFVSAISCLIGPSYAASSVHRVKREDDVSVGQMFAELLDSILGDTKNTTLNSTTNPTTFSLLKTLSSRFGLTRTTTTPSPTLMSLNSTSSNLPENFTVVIGNETTSTGTNANTLTSVSPEFLDIDDHCDAVATFKEMCRGDGLSDVILNLNVWDVYGVMFSNDVIEALLLNCASGHWCLYDEFDYWNGLMMEKAAMVRASPIFSDICQETSKICLQNLLSNITDCPIEERLNFTVQAIDLLCRIRTDQTQLETCYAHILASLHVTVVEFLRDEDDKNLREESLNGECNSPEILMTKSVLCVESKCPNHNEDLLSFKPWHWFTPNIESYKSKCNLPDDTCDEDAVFGSNGTFTSLASYPQTTETWTSTPPSTKIPSDTSRLTGTDVGEDADLSLPAKLTMILGIGAGGVIAVSGFFVLIYACWRKHGYFKADKIGYTPLRNQD